MIYNFLYDSTESIQMYNTPSQHTNILLAAQYNLIITAFDLSTGQAVKEFEISNSQANKMINAPNNHFYVASYSYVFAYDFESKSHKAIQNTVAHEGNVSDIVLSNSVMITCGDDKKVKIWDIRTNSCQVTINTKSQNNAVVYYPDTYNQIIVGDESGYITSFDLRTANRLKELKVDNLPVRAMSQSVDNIHFIAAMQNGNTKCFQVGLCSSETKNQSQSILKPQETETTSNQTESLEPFSELYSIHSHNDVQLNCCYSPNGQLFATCASNNTARIWDAHTGDMKQNLIPSEMREWIWDICFTPDSLNLCMGGTDGICKQYDVENGRITMSLPKLDKIISAITVIAI